MKLILIFGLLGCVCSASVGSSPDIVPIRGGLSGDGTTTRYWDCCAPSCSYYSYIDTKDGHPDQTCKIDGVTSSTRVDNGDSGCVEGGVAYTCNNHQPWVVNNTLAYGWTGAAFKDEPDSSECCRCLLLSFKDKLAGKKMLVQMVNIGNYYTKNQFDILIPGGGVGDINTGCMNQWKTGENGWGQRYGGVSSIQECSTLPEVLQPGCRFRFEFMEGVDNPKVTFTEVQCPKELVAISRCGDL